MFDVATLEQSMATLKIGTMREKFNLTSERLQESEPDEPEAALFAGGFKGRCHQCGKYGHKVADCGNLFCRYCKKDGHTIKDCSSLKAKEERELLFRPGTGRAFCLLHIIYDKEETVQ
jgi:hypothetical protein